MIVILVHLRRLCILAPTVPRRFLSCSPLFRFVFSLSPFLWVLTILDSPTAIMVSLRHIAHVIPTHDVLCPTHSYLRPPCAAAGTCGRLLFLIH